MKSESVKSESAKSESVKKESVKSESVKSESESVKSEDSVGVCWPVIDFTIRKPRGKVADGIPREGISGFILFNDFVSKSSKHEEKIRP